MALRSPLTVQPFDYIADSNGRPLDYGQVYIGVANQDPEFYQIPVYLDAAMTKPIDQPIRTNDGFVDFAGSLSELYASAEVYSVKVLDKQGRKVLYKGDMTRKNLMSDALTDLNQSIIDTQTAAQITLNAAVNSANTEVAQTVSLATAAIDTATTKSNKAATDADAAIKTLFENGGLPATPFATKASMEIDGAALVDGTYAAVTNDDDKTKNGLYLKKAGVWIELDFGKPEVDKKYIDIESSNLFAKTLDTKFPDANLPVRRYLNTGAITNYSRGTYQVASEQGLKINVPASGSSATVHYFSTGATGYSSVDMEFTLLTADAAIFSIGLGYINSNEDYVMYNYSSSGALRDYVGAASTSVALGKPTYVTGDKIRLVIKDKDLTYYKNDEVIYERELTEGINGREILIGQGGFNEYSVSMKAVNDPIRDYVDSKIAADVPVVEPTANNPKCFYEYSSTGISPSTESIKVYTKIKDNSYIGFVVAHQVDMRDIQYQDYWRITEADYYTLESGAMVATGKKALDTGENEFVWKQSSEKSDFTGGYHGDEVVTDITFLVNGLPISLTTNIALTACNSFEYIEKSTMHETANRDGDAFIAGHPIVAYHIKNTAFYDGGYRTYNRITFNYEGVMSTLYHGISCISKDAAKFVITDGSYVVTEMTGGGGEGTIETGSREYYGYNLETGLSSKATAKIINDSTADLASTFFVSDRSVDSKYYRKSPPKNVVTGEVMESEFSCFFDKS